MDDHLRAAKAPEPKLPVPAPNAEAAVYLQMLRLKRQYRRGWLQRGVAPQHCESVADHAWGCAMLALLLAGREGLDPGRCALLALAHELGEIHAGDITPHDGVGPAEKREREAAAFARLFAPDPASPALDQAGFDQAKAFISALWREYEDGQSPEARFVKRIDRLEMGFQAAVYARELGKPLDDFRASVDQSLQGSPLEALWGELSRAGFGAVPPDSPGR